MEKYEKIRPGNEKSEGVQLFIGRAIEIPLPNQAE
jgi:hypothetical protein